MYKYSFPNEKQAKKFVPRPGTILKRHFRILKRHSILQRVALYVAKVALFWPETYNYAFLRNEKRGRRNEITSTQFSPLSSNHTSQFSVPNSQFSFFLVRPVRPVLPNFC